MNYLMLTVKTKRGFWLVVLAFIILPAYSQVYLQSETKRVNSGKVISTKNEIYLEIGNGQMSVHYFQPSEFYVFTNVFGEMTVYFPKSNEVMKQQNMFYSSENEIIYQFFTNNANDLGLAASGFVLKDTKNEGQYLVTTWKLAGAKSTRLVKAELVQEDYLPIYIAFFDANDKIVQKIYFSNWKNTELAFFPTKITQIDFITEKDSIVSRKVYSDVITGALSKNKFPTITIPENAKLIIDKKK